MGLKGHVLETGRDGAEEEVEGETAARQEKMRETAGLREGNQFSTRER